MEIFDQDFLGMSDTFIGVPNVKLEDKNYVHPLFVSQLKHDKG